jgi:PAS domain S-box-containing protein
VAAGFVLLALLLNLFPAARELPFLFFFGAVALSARICGFGPAIFATLLSGLTANFFLMPPRFAFSVSAADLLRLIFFTLVCILISSIARQKTLVERAAEQNRAKLSAIVESSEDAIFSKTLDGTITTWNQGAEKLYGYTAAEIVGENVSLLAAAPRKQEIAAIMNILRQGGRVEHYETQRVRKDGTTIDISLSVSPLFDSEGKIIGAASIARDITQRNLAEETLRKTEKLAAAGRLSATIAHEINNPLEAVTNLLYLMQRNQSLDEKARRHLAMADQEIRRVAHVAKQTLGFYRDTSSAVHTDVSVALEEVLGLYMRKVSAKRIRVEKDYDTGVEVLAFPGEIRQVFSNLIANAIDAIADGGRLIVRASKSHRWHENRVAGVRITIADSGTGIPAEHKARIFEPFYTTKQDVGTGLGLWLTREIVQKHRGTISVRSTTRKGHSGTVFSVFLPGEVGPESVTRGATEPAQGLLPTNESDRRSA